MLTTRQVCKHLNVCPNTLRKLRREWGLRWVRVGRVHRYCPKALERALERMMEG